MEKRHRKPYANFSRLDTNYGTNDLIKIQTNSARTGFIRFDLSSVVDNPVTTATLTLSVLDNTE